MEWFNQLTILELITIQNPLVPWRHIFLNNNLKREIEVNLNEALHIVIINLTALEFH